MGYVAGPDAFEEWAIALERGPEAALSYHGNSYVAECMHEAKETASTFLKRLAKKYASRPQAEHLTKAAQEYAASETLLKQFTWIFPFAMEGAMPPDSREKGAGLLRSVKPHELAAIARMREAYKSWK